MSSNHIVACSVAKYVVKTFVWFTVLEHMVHVVGFVPTQQKSHFQCVFVGVAQIQRAGAYAPGVGS